MANFSPYGQDTTGASLKMYEASTGKTISRTFSKMVNLTAIVGGDPDTTLTPPKILMADGTFYNGTPQEFLDEFFRALCSLTTNSFRNVIYGKGFNIVGGFTDG